MATDEQRARFACAEANARKILKPGDRIRVTNCPGTKRWIIFAGWSGHWIVSKSGIDDYAPTTVDRVNDDIVDFTATLAGTTSTCEWHDTYWRERRVRVAACPETTNRECHYSHELTVAEAFPDNLSHVYCTCGWVGPGADTDENAVILHNSTQGVGFDPVSPWVIHQNPPDTIIGADDELPF